MLLKLKEIQKVRNRRYILASITDNPAGHDPYFNPEVWGSYLKDLLEITSNK